MPLDTKDYEKDISHEVIKSQKGGDVILHRNADTELALQIIKANFPDYIEKSPAKLVRGTPQNPDANADFDPFTKEIRLDYGATPSERKGKIEDTRTFSTESVIGRTLTLMHEIYHSREVPTASQASKFFSDSGKSILEDAKKSEFPSSGDLSMHEFLATATTIKRVERAGINLDNTHYGKYSSSLKRMEKQYPGLSKFLATMEQPEIAAPKDPNVLDKIKSLFKEEPVKKDPWNMNWAEEAVNKVKEVVKNHPSLRWWGEGDSAPKELPPKQPIVTKVDKMPLDQLKKLRYNDPSLDAYTSSVELSMGLPRGVLLGIKNAGERSNSNQVSSAGAQGVIQMMPGTRKSYPHDPSNPIENIKAGGKYMKDLIDQYGGNVRAAIAHYNGGSSQGKLVSEGKEPTKRETKQYLYRIDEYLRTRGGNNSDGKPLSLQETLTRDPQARSRFVPRPDYLGGAKETAINLAAGWTADTLGIPADVANLLPKVDFKAFTSDWFRDKMGFPARDGGSQQMLADLAGNMSPKGVVTTLGMVVGAHRLANMNSKLKIAQEMYKAGKSDQEVFQTTGLFKSATGDAIKGFIPDDTLVFRTSGVDILKEQGRTNLDGLIIHPELFKAIPELRGTQVILRPEVLDKVGSMAAYSPSTNTIILSKAPKTAEETSYLIHEIQHAVQKVEKWDSGTSRAKELENMGFNPTTFNQDMKNVRERITSLRDTLTKADKEFYPFGVKSDIESGMSKEMLSQKYPKLANHMNDVKKWHDATVELDMHYLAKENASSAYMHNSGEVMARQTQHAYINQNKKFDPFFYPDVTDPSLIAKGN